MVKPTIGANEWTKSVEEPSMAVQFLLVLFLEAKDNLNWTWSRRNFASVGDNDLRGIPGHEAISVIKIQLNFCEAILEDMCGDIFASNGVFCHTFLVASHLRIER